MDSETDARLRAIEQQLAGLPVRIAPSGGGGSGVERQRGELTASFDRGTWEEPTTCIAIRYKPPSGLEGEPWEATDTLDVVCDNGFIPSGGLDNHTIIQYVKLYGQWWYDGGCNIESDGDEEEE